MKENTQGQFDARGTEMSSKREGMVTRNLLSLELQLKTLFEDCGGANSLALLDSLSKLSKAEQEMALKVFATVCDRVSAREVRPVTNEEEDLKRFEEDLYQSIVSEIDQHQKQQTRSTIALSVLDGGLSSENKVVQFSPQKRSQREQRPLESA